MTVIHVDFSRKHRVATPSRWTDLVPGSIILNGKVGPIQRVPAKPASHTPPEKVIGAQYESTKDLDVADIAKLIRADIKAAKKRGDLPKSLKTSVRISRYAGGQSLDVTVKGGIPVHTEAYLRWYRAGDYRTDTPDRYVPSFKALKAALKAIVEAYNFDGSDLMTDYFNVRFYGDVLVDSDVLKREAGQ